MKSTTVQENLNNFIATSYAKFSSLPKESLKTNNKLLQQVTLQLGSNTFLLDFGVYRGYFCANASLLKGDLSRGMEKSPDNLYEIVVKAEPRFQIKEEKANTEELNLRTQIINAMFKAAQASIEGFFPEYRLARDVVYTNSPVKIITHPLDIPKGFEYSKTIPDNLEALEKMQTQQREETFQKNEERIFFVGGKRTFVFERKKAA